jgi:hypothetical protein
VPNIIITCWDNFIALSPQNMIKSRDNPTFHVCSKYQNPLKSTKQTFQLSQRSVFNWYINKKANTLFQPLVTVYFMIHQNQLGGSFTSCCWSFFLTLNLTYPRVFTIRMLIFFPCANGIINWTNSQNY